MKSKLLIIKVLLIFISILFIVFNGCSSNDNPAAPPGGGSAVTINSFTASPSSVSSQGDSVTLSWKVTGATNVSISGVGEVTPADSGSKKVFVNATTTFTLTAANSANSATATTTVTAAASMTVTGEAKDFGGDPIVGAAIIIDGRPPVTTSSNGSFTVTDVIAPYNITMIIGSQKTAVIYQGLTKTNPTLIFLFGFVGSANTATISGTVPAVSGTTTRVFFVSGEKSWRATASTTSGNYTINASWNGTTASFSGKLYVLRWTTGSNGMPNSYEAYGEKSLTISNGGTFNNNNFAASELTDPADQNISGTVTKPSSGYSLNQRAQYILFGNSLTFLASEGGTLSDNFSYIVPNIPGATFGITAGAVESNRRAFYFKSGIAANSTGVSIPLSSAPQLSIPVDNATNIDTSTSFLFTAGGGNGINYVRISSSGSNPAYLILTSNSTFKIPNLSAQGLGLPSGQSYNWNVAEYFPISSMDDAASDNFVPLLSGNRGDLGNGTSENFSFTTQ